MKKRTSYKICSKCGREISASNYKRHVDCCNRIIEEKTYICDICGKECNKHSLAYHKWVMHTEEGEKWRSTHSEKVKKANPDLGKKVSASLREGYRSGRLKPTKKTEEGRRKLAEASHRRGQTKETKEKLSAIIQKRYAEGWMPRAGRCKKIQYESPIAGLISVDGSWELSVAKYLDEQKLQWVRNIKKFEYIDDEGRVRKYTPDFYIESWGAYLEIKGYETDLDRAKWRCFPEKLIVWKKKELEELGMLR